MDCIAPAPVVPPPIPPPMGDNMARKEPKAIAAMPPDDTPPTPPTLGLSDALLAMDEEPSELDKILELLLDPRNIQHNTELNQNEITAFSVLSTMRKRHKLPVLDDFLLENQILRVSKKRGGRKEWVKILARHLQQEGMDDIQQNAGARWWRRKK